MVVAIGLEHWAARTGNVVRTPCVDGRLTFLQQVEPKQMLLIVHIRRLKVDFNVRNPVKSARRNGVLARTDEDKRANGGENDFVSLQPNSQSRWYWAR